MEPNKGFQTIAAKARLSLNPDVQRPDNYQKYGELATTTPTARKIEENIRAIPP